MPLSHVTKVFAASDAKIWPLTADPAGGAATYGAGIDVPGLKTVSIEGDINSVELRGDNMLLDAASNMSNITVGMEFAKQSLDLLSAWFTSALVVDSGVTPNQKALWTLTGGSGLAYFGLTAKAVGADSILGDVQFSIYKAILSSFPEMGLEEEDYKTATVEFKAMPLLATGNKWMGIALNETGAALAAPA